MMTIFAQLNKGIYALIYAEIINIIGIMVCVTIVTCIFSNSEIVE